MLNQLIACQGEKPACDWLLQKRIESRKKCIALLQTLVQGELKSPAEWAGLPSLGPRWSLNVCMGIRPLTFLNHSSKALTPCMGVYPAMVRAGHRFKLFPCFWINQSSISGQCFLSVPCFSLTLNTKAVDLFLSLTTGHGCHQVFTSKSANCDLGGLAQQSGVRPC